MTATSRVVAIAAGLVLAIILTIWIVSGWFSYREVQTESPDLTGSEPGISSASVNKFNDLGIETATPLVAPARPDEVAGVSTLTTMPAPVQPPTSATVQKDKSTRVSNTGLLGPSPTRSSRSGPNPTEPYPAEQSSYTVQPAPSVTVDRSFLATAAARKTPRHLTLTAARKEVSFPILMPTYLPERFEPLSPWDFVMLLEGIAYGNQVKGVRITFKGRNLLDDGFLPTFHIEEELGSRPANTEVLDSVKSEVDILGFPATIWETQNIDGRPLIVLFWEDPNKGMWVSFDGFVTKDEAIKILETLQ